MNKKLFILLFALALTIGFIFVSFTSTARAAVNQLFVEIERGNVPEPSSVAALANLVEFGLPQFTVRGVRITSPLTAKAEVALSHEGQRANVTLDLRFTGWSWVVRGATESELFVGIQDHPRLFLELDGSTLARDLQPLGKDKLLTVQSGRSEWLWAGWQDRAEYFQAFYGGDTTDVKVGMSLSLYTHNDKVAAALTSEPFTPGDIRVNISTSGFGGIHHQEIDIYSGADWVMTEAVTGRRLDLPSGQISLSPRDGGILVRSPQGEETLQQRLIFHPKSPEGRLEITSVQRSLGQPAYMGSLEVANFDGSLIIVNELPLEQYLFSVLPSEMPASFGIAALDVQAIVARTYAVNNMLASRWQASSAHVVDSVLSQVYNNIAENSAARAAVLATVGEIVTYRGRPADVRFFSTSSGYTGAAHEVWRLSSAVPWLGARPQYPGPARDLTDEGEFADFIRNPPAAAYDAGSPWFRWQITMPAQRLAEVAEENLVQIHSTNPSYIQQLNTSGEYATVESMPASPLGQILDLRVAQRGEGGVLVAVDIVGSNGTWRVLQEYYIRHVLRPLGTGAQPVRLHRHNGSFLDNFNLLPSGYVMWELNHVDEVLASVTYYGGGFGHGAGMSQYGVRGLVGLGWSREQIIQHYFPGSEVSNIYR